MRDRLYRSRDERILGGVGGGIADWLDVDPALVRIVLALLCFAGGIGFLLYLVMWFVIPEEPESAGAGMTPPVLDPVTGQPVATAPSYSPDPGRPDREARRAARRAARVERDGRGAVIFGVLLVLVGSWALARNYLDWLPMEVVGPASLIAVGLVVMLLALRRTP